LAKQPFIRYVYLMKAPTLQGWLKDGPFTLALSSSFFGFYAHCGVAEALFEAGCLPSRITGSSAGALVGGALASGLSPEQTKSILFGVKREHFWDPHPGLGYLKGRKFLELLESNFCPTFERAKIPFEAAAFDLMACRTKFINEGSLPKAVLASCAVPLLFHPVRIGSRFFLDGGVFHKSGISPNSQKDRVLCVFLQGKGISDSYELGRSLKRLEQGHRVLRIRELTRLDYNSLDKGHLAYREARLRTSNALKECLGNKITDA
jgi:NTE family protein